MKKYFLIIFLLILGSGLVFFLLKKPLPPKEKILEEVIVQPVWVPNAQYAGLYVAMERGFYEKEGLKVKINEYDEKRAVKDYVLSGEAHFGIDGGDQVIIAHSEGKPLRALAVIYRLNPVAFAVHQDLNVRSPKDLKGKKIGFLPDNTSVIMKALLGRYGLSEKDIEWVPYGYDLSLFYERKIEEVFQPLNRLFLTTVSFSIGTSLFFLALSFFFSVVVINSLRHLAMAAGKIA